ncbi:MAG: MFS transporter [Ardenticatenaceae bacterium]|nr:MFS transporter [Ardenticatenaceae bacterium]
MAKNSRFQLPPSLQHHDFRLFWIGRLLSTTGSQMQFIAVNWHIFNLLRDQTYTIELFGRSFELGAQALGLGAVGLVRVIPIIIFGLWGGILADTMDRRKLMLWVQALAMIFSGLLAYITFTGQDTVFFIYLLSAAGAGATAIDNPARQSIIPSLVPRQHFANAVSLNTLMYQIANIGGPAVAGLLVGRFDVGLVYVIDAISFGAVVISLLLMEYRGAPSSKTAKMDWASIKEGFQFTFGTRIIRSTMLLDFIATFFASARSMLPIVAENILQVGASGYGLLSTAQAVGSLVAGSILSVRDELDKQGKVLLVSVGIYGLATAVFGFSTIFWLSYVLFALTGAADTVSTVIRGTLRQLMTPDELRGRMTSVNMLFFMGGPQLGELEAGLVAAVWGAPFAIITGGVATVILTALIAWGYPSLRQYNNAAELATDD